ncbi:uncharacterized protein LOC130918447 [Corythoichthys intestinalis]|uniref:uncharacterized protein LOC130918447 n=1 Tax=Corythoichthys intestinalis TaxID=161448 RepID=UPI0025A678DD|nr:uncharacterized protein LOC130918447 [Corythoichthys intestinalis]
MCKVQVLRTLVKQRLNLAVEEIFELFERTIAEYEEELFRSRGENARHHELVQPLSQQGSVKQVLVEIQQEEPVEPPHIVGEVVWSDQDEEKVQELKKNVHVNTFSHTGVHVKSEDDDIQQVLSACEEEQESTSSMNLELVPLQIHENLACSQDGVHLQGQKEEIDIIPLTLTETPSKTENNQEAEPCDDFALLASNSSEVDHGVEPKEPQRTYKTSQGIRSKAAEVSKRYRARRDADPDRRRRYLEKERDKWKQSRETGKRKSVHELSEMEKCALRKKWRESKSQSRARNRASTLLQSETLLEFPPT